MPDTFIPTNQVWDRETCYVQNQFKQLKYERSETLSFCKQEQANNPTHGIVMRIPDAFPG